MLAKLPNYEQEIGRRLDKCEIILRPIFRPGNAHPTNNLYPLRTVFCSHDTLFGITFTSPVALPVSRVILLTSAAIETGMVVRSAYYHGDFTLQSGVSDGTKAVHAIFVVHLFPWHFFVFVDARVGSKLSVAVTAFATMMTKQVAVKVVGRHRIDDER